jgi:hypothetical protein
MPTTNAFVLALAAGLISAVVFASATAGPMALRLALYFLTPLSLYLAGLGLGVAAVGIAAIVATILIMLLSNPITAGAYAISAAVPAVVCTRLALLNRVNGDEREWYPIGRVVTAAAVFGGVFACLLLLLMGGDVDALTKMMRTAIDTFVKSEIAGLPGAPAMTEDQIDELARATLKSLPWALGGIAMAMILFNLWLAGRITHASGRLQRPWPDLPSFTLPSAATFALCVATALAFLGGMPGLVAGGFAAPFYIAFALVGLALIHTTTRGSSWRPFALSALYGSLLIFTAGFMLMLAIAGLIETVIGYRQIRNRTRQNNSDE